MVDGNGLAELPRDSDAKMGLRGQPSQRARSPASISVELHSTLLEAVIRGVHGTFLAGDCKPLQAGFEAVQTAVLF